MKPLENIRILVTRPIVQAESLCQQLQAQGAIPIRLPVLRIEAIPENFALHQWATCLSKIHKLVFISVNAVEHALPVLYKTDPHSMQTISCFAVGQRTATALQAYGVKVISAPPPFNSESLLTLPPLQKLDQQHILIFRGIGGRELLAEVLRARGATVEYCDVYRRVLPALEVIPDKVDMIMVTSRESLQNLQTLLGECAWLHQTPLILLSERIAETARTLGWQAPLISAHIASDEGLVHAALQWQYSQMRHTIYDGQTDSSNSCHPTT
jgi:uroporphyrinogen-III synthase